MEMVKIIECSAVDCSYNKDQKCHAIAITVGGPEPTCDTFMTAKRKGGVVDMTGGVGACKVEDCAFNQSLECSAGGIDVGMHGGHPDCNTYRRQ